jgi:hypothetical protein
MVVVQNRVKDASGDGIGGVLVTASLASPGYLDDGTIVSSVSTTSAATTGLWSLDLPPNTDINPAGTHYRIREAGRTSAIVVPDAAGPLEMVDLLVAPPEDPDSVTVGVTSVDGRDGIVTLSDLYAALVHASRHATGGADPLTPAAIGAFPESGGELEGDLSLTENNITVSKTGGTEAFRIRSTGGAIDLEHVGTIVVTNWGSPGFTGTENMRQRWHSGGITYAGRVTYAPTIHTSAQFIDGGGGEAYLGGKDDNGVIQIVGSTGSDGPPTTGTFNAGDLALDDRAVWWICTVGGTPGTWKSTDVVYIGRDMGLANWDDVISVIDQADDSATEPDTGLWPDRFELRFRGQLVQWWNEFMEWRGVPAYPANDGSGVGTVGWRLFAALNETAYNARSSATPVWSIANYRSGSGSGEELASLNHLGEFSLGAPAWSGLTLGTGVIDGTNAAEVRLEHSYRVVRMRGGIINNSGGVISSGTTLATVPAGFRPSQSMSIPVRTRDPDAMRELTINSDGTIVNASGTDAGSEILLDAITWTTDV